jgi:basic membrane lipoprotein Med (substrate-binding protein (PBP1-ABC) superfamily)
MPNLTKRRTLITIGTAVLIAAGTLTYFALRSGPQARTYPPARTRTTIDFTACLLTPPAGTSATPQSQAAYNGLLKAQATTNIRVQTFQTHGAETAANAQTAVNTLALRGCNLITAATPIEAAAVEQQARLFTATRFAVVTKTKPGTTAPANLTVEPDESDSAITAEISQLTISSLARHS